MRCPKCNSENNDSAKFCKKCGNPLSATEMSHENVINSISNKKSDGDDKTKIIIVALIIVAIVLAGALVYIYGFGNSSPVQSDNQQSVQNDDNQDSDTVEASQSSQSSQPAQSSSKNMKILSGSFSTGSSLEDKTYASIYVGPEFAGENVIIQIYYSRDGSTLNNGNMVPKTVDSSGYIEVRSADAYKYYPDYAEINLYDSSSNLLDTQSVSLSPSSGTQTF